MSNISIDPTKEVYIKDEGDYASVRQSGSSEIGILHPSTDELHKFYNFLESKNVSYESEYNDLRN